MSTSKGTKISLSINKNSLLPAVLSFFITGLGQVHNGQIAKGALLFFSTAILGMLSVGLLAIPVWLYGILDAYKMAELKPRKKS